MRQAAKAISSQRAEINISQKDTSDKASVDAKATNSKLLAYEKFKATCEKDVDAMIVEGLKEKYRDRVKAAQEISDDNDVQFNSCDDEK